MHRTRRFCCNGQLLRKLSKPDISMAKLLTRRSQRSLARTLGSWVRIPLKAWMSILCAHILFVLFCVQATAFRRVDPPSKESYRLCVGSRNRKSDQGPTKGCRDIIIIIIIIIITDMTLMDVTIIITTIFFFFCSSCLIYCD
jgi:hypothetical protein